MFKLNLKIAFRNLLKNRTYAAINIFSLAIGLAGFIVILLYINLETGYDKWDPSLKQVYQIGTYKVKNEAEIKKPEITGQFVEIVKKSVPGVESVTMGQFGTGGYEREYLYKNRKVKVRMNIAGADENFFNIYPIKPLMGSFEDLQNNKNGIAISLDVARQVFGNDDPIGKILVEKGNSNFKDQLYQVKAVWDEQQYPGYFKINAFMAFNRYIYGDQVPISPFSVMVKLHKDADPEKTLAAMETLYLEDLAKRAQDNSNAGIRLSKAQSLAILKEKQGVTHMQVIMEPVSDLNLNSFFAAAPKQKTIYILTALASFLIIISCVNFTNLAIVQANGRAKEVGVKKVLGAFRSTLITQFLIETALQCVAAFFIAVVVAELMLPTVNQMLGSELILFNAATAGRILGQAVLILLAVILISGIYPALFLSGFRPAMVLKGNFATSMGSVSLRKVLMMLQFTIAGALAICFMVMNTQLNYMRAKDLGMQPSQVMVLSIADYDIRTQNADEFAATKQRLLNIKGVQMVSRSADNLIGPSDWHEDVAFRGKKLNIDLKSVDPDYFELINAKIVKGRSFTKEFLGIDTLEGAILNETAFKMFGLSSQLGEYVNTGDPEDGETGKLKVVGVVRDMQIDGFDKAINPVIYVMDSGHWRKKVFLKLDAVDISNTIKAVTAFWKTVEPKDEPFYTFADEKFAKLNDAYERMSKIMFSFSMITLLVSVLGLFTLAAYNSKIRLKEIAIRKILGASTASILKVLSTDLVKVIILANVVGDIFAYIYMKQWFTGFVYRIDMPVLPFLLVNAGTILLTILTVSMQSYKAVNASPVAALKYE